jgi:hypothetical protein
VLVSDTPKMPLTGCVPVQPPAAVHEDALVEDQVTVEMLPEVMLVGFAEIATAGVAVAPPEFPPTDPPPAGYALFDPGKTGTPPGTSSRTMLTLEVDMGWFDPSFTTLVPGTRSVIGMVTAKVRHVF